MTLPDPELADSHVHIHFDGREFNLATTEKDAEVVVNGKKKSTPQAAARGPHPHRQRRDASSRCYDEPVADEAEPTNKSAELDVVQASSTSSRHKLMASYELPTAARRADGRR